MPASPPGERLLSAEASFIALDMLDKNPAPTRGSPHPGGGLEDGHLLGVSRRVVRGIFGRYVLVVWIGNFDNTGNPAFVGVQAAAPLFFRIVDALRNQASIPGASPGRLRAASRASRCAPPAAICRMPTVRKPWPPGTSRASRPSGYPICIGASISTPPAAAPAGPGRGS